MRRLCGSCHAIEAGKVDPVQLLAGPKLDIAELEGVELAIADALRRGGEPELPVLGYGEISVVLKYEAKSGETFALKRLSAGFVASDTARLDRFETTIAKYVDQLEARGVQVVPTSLQRVPKQGGAIAVYVVQPILAPESLLTNRMHAASSSEDAVRLFEMVTARVVAVASPALGIDSQLANWALNEDGQLLYMDITTPFLRDTEGRQQVDIDIFIVTLPPLLRQAVKTFLIGGLLDKYHDPRIIVVDILANMIKEKLHHHLPPCIESANRFLSSHGLAGEITEDEVRAYYAEDASTYIRLQALRRYHRSLVRTLGYEYPFVLPPANMAR